MHSHVFSHSLLIHAILLFSLYFSVSFAIWCVLLSVINFVFIFWSTIIIYIQCIIYPLPHASNVQGCQIHRWGIWCNDIVYHHIKVFFDLLPQVTSGPPISSDCPLPWHYYRFDFIDSTIPPDEQSTLA